MTVENMIALIPKEVYELFRPIAQMKIVSIIPGPTVTADYLTRVE